MITINPSDWLQLENKYASKCKSCGVDIPVGEKVLWRKGAGVKHISCEVSLKELDVSHEAKPIISIITDKEWSDYKQYESKHLYKIFNCQCCGNPLDKTKDMYNNNGRRTCERCFMV